MISVASQYFTWLPHSTYHPTPPSVLAGDRCRPCECNGNILPWDEYGCDDITGECLNCLNNTYGVACERCAPGYFGDAVDRKDCTSE